MKADLTVDPIKIICKKGEKITVAFNPSPLNSLSVITYCFKPVCSKDDQRQVIGTQFSFTVEKDFPLQIFFFFTPGEPFGRCNLRFTSSNGDTFDEPVTVFEDTTELLPRRIYIFEVE